MTETMTLPRKTREMQTPFFDSTKWNDFPFRDDDIVIATFAKTGTTWTQQIVGQMILGPDPDCCVLESSPWVDYPTPSKEETLAMLEAQTHRRFLKTHLPADALVFSPKAKYLYIGRDGRDVLWSLHNHFVNMTEEIWDALRSRARADGPAVEPPPDDIHTFWKQWMGNDEEEFSACAFWAHIRGWWEIRNLSNVKLVHFANLKRDMPGQMREIAAFLDIDIAETKWDPLVEYCSFDWMKRNADKCIPGGGAFMKGGAQTFIHKGNNGRWTDTLTADEIAEYETRVLHALGAECAQWLATGSTLSSRE